MRNSSDDSSAEGASLAGAATRARRFIGTLLGILAINLLTTPTLAQSYPTSPVRVLVPFGAGGATDILARVFSDRLQQNLGQAFVVENRGGAAGQIAATAFARAPADGNTIMFTTAAPITIAPLMNEKIQYDPRKDFAPVAQLAVQPLWLVVSANSPLKTFEDVIAAGRDNPGKLTYGTSGVGTELHLLAEALALSAKLKMVHVPFRGGGDVITAVMGGQVDFAVLATASIAGPLKQGTLRAIAVSSPQRMSDFPDVPTVAELGYPDASMMPWWGIMVPSGTPQTIIERLTEELRKISREDIVRERLKATFVRIDFAEPKEFAKRLETEAAQYGTIIRNAGIKLKQ